MSITVATEISQNKLTADGLLEAYKALNLHHLYGTSDLAFFRGLGDDVLVSAFQRRTEQVEDPGRREYLFNQTEVLAQYTRSSMLRSLVESMRKPPMDKERATKILFGENGELPEDDDFVISIAEIRVSQRSPMFGVTPCWISFADMSGWLYSPRQTIHPVTRTPSKKL